MLPNYISMDWDCYVSVDNEIEQLNSLYESDKALL